MRTPSPYRRYSGITLLFCILAGSKGWAGADTPAQTADSWKLLPLPLRAQETTPPRRPDPRAETGTGFGWYRCWIRIPEQWPGRWDLTLHLHPANTALEVYFNGQSIGKTGSMPPDFQPAQNQSYKISIPPARIESGGLNHLAIRAYPASGTAGVFQKAPFITRYHQEMVLDGKWEFRSGDQTDWAQAVPPAHPAALFDTIRDAVTPIEPPAAFTHGEYWPPGKAEAKMQTAADLELELLLAEPRVTQPLNLHFDERGRLWVVQYRQYPFPAGLNMISRDKYFRAVYDKTSPPPPRHYQGRDRITIHEDTNGDGSFDRHQVFVDGLNLATACVTGRGGVWVLNPPYLLFYPDRNRDDKPDSDPEVHLEGFGIEDTHSVVNSLRWGPDGWLYAAQGSTVSGQVKTPEGSSPVHSMGQLIWRYHPESRQYEIFAEGGGNAFGCEIDSRGRLFSGHNGGNTRGFHYVQGAYYQKGFTKHGPLSNPYAMGYFPAMNHPEAPRFTHTFVIYEATALPSRFHGNLIGLEPLQSRLIHSDLFPHGSTFQTKDLGHPLSSEDASFRPVDIKVGPDGALYIADFYEDYIAHGQHFQGYIDPTSGRVYRVRAKASQPIEPFDLAEKTSAELLELLRHDNKWFRQTALRLLGDRRDATVIPILRRWLRQETGRLALEALWALNLSGGFDENVAETTLNHPNPHVRAWTIRLLGDDRLVSDSMADLLAQRAAREPEVTVRSQLACTAKRLPAEDALPILRKLIVVPEDADDPHLPLLLWWAIESQCTSQPDAVLSLFSEPDVWSQPIVERHLLERVMRRFAASGRREGLLACARLLNLAPSPAHRQKLMTGFEKAFQGRSLPSLPAKLEEAIADAGGGSLPLRLRQQDPKAISEALQKIKRPQTGLEQRVQWIRLLGELQIAESVPVLLQGLASSREPELLKACLTALQTFDAPSIASKVIERYPDWPAPVQAAAQTLVVSRTQWSQRFLQAVESGHISTQSISMLTQEKLRTHSNKDVAQKAQALFETGESGRGRVQELLQVVRSGKGNPYDGKELYELACAACHQLFDQGGRIGPDLTPYQRDDLRRLLSNIVYPNAEIREGYQTYEIHTRDGRVLTGFLADQDNQAVVLRSWDGQSQTLARDQINQMQPTGRSLMPQGLLASFSDRQIRDLVAYLRTGQPLNE